MPEQRTCPPTLHSGAPAVAPTLMLLFMLLSVTGVAWMFL